ncbi:hypothetical protein NLI96_g10484 [Meripilus lineatus]|uniref:Uncharacterized protein n=1 Tax=Meripilus lineatus TaxID=2056292 RepID=A0AAD5YBX8_9APHY|nr:hypothetical protein NLI96_g10484 [Physisporinus lineatus]
MDPSQDRSQDVSQDPSQDPTQENMLPLAVAVVEPHAIPLPIPLSPLSLPPSSPPPSSLPPSPPPSLRRSPIASSSNLNANPSSSLTPPQLGSLAVTHYTPPLLYYAPAPAGQYIQPGWNPELGFPLELWEKILDILFKSRSALALLACALTCRDLRWPAQLMINRLKMRQIRSWMYEDIDGLVEDVRDAPRDAKRITTVEFVPEKRDDKSPGSAVALSVAPLRLAGQRALTKMCSLGFGYPGAGREIEAHFHPRSCPLYGRAFPNVTWIGLINFQFPSFMDFAFFVTSFPALTSLTIVNVACRNQVIPPSVARGPKKLNIRLSYLRVMVIEVNSGAMNEKRFAETFSWWILRRCGQFPKKICFNETLLDHSWGREVLRHCSESLQEAQIFLDSEVRRSQDDFARDSWLDAFKPGSPIAETVELHRFKESDIPMMQIFISCHMGPTQIVNLKAIRPTTEDFYSLSWKMLDILLFSWYMLHGRGNGQTLFFEGLWVPQELWDKQQAVKEEATKVKENPWLHSLFPLNMAVGKGMWLGSCYEGRSYDP